MARPLLILGAGLAGLSAAYAAAKARRPYLLFEKEERPGGLVRSHSLGGFTFDHSGHLLHMAQPRTRALLFGELGLERAMRSLRRDAWVWSFGRYTRAPFQAHLHGLPASVRLECLEGLLRARGALPAAGRGPRRRRGAFRSFEDFNLSSLGAGIYRHFMEPYNTKLWGLHPSRLSDAFMGRFVPRPSLSQVFAGAFGETPEELGYNASFYYPRRGGMELLAQAFAARVRARCGIRAVGLDARRRRLRLSDGQELSYGRLISSLPLPALVGLDPAAPAAVRRAAARLRAASVLTVNLGIAHRVVSDKQWVYVPGTELPFYRVGFYHSLSPALAPAGGSSLYAELSYSAERPLDKAKAPAAVKAGLRRMGILRPGDRIAAQWLADIPGAYVLYDAHRKPAVERIQDWLQGCGIRSVGRWGRWEYAAMEDAIWQGAEAAA